MTRTRSIIVGVAATALLAVPGVAAASSGHGAAGRTQLHRTEVHFLTFPHMGTHAVAENVVGQLIGFEGTHHGALADATVTLYSRNVGTTTWVRVESGQTSNTATPTFTLPFTTGQNADYKVTFGGNGTFAASQNTTWFEVYRTFNGIIHDGTNTATLTGHVWPYYTGKAVTLQKKTCGLCDFTSVKTITTGTDGAYSFALPAPPSGAWYWRLTIAGTTAYAQSWGATYSTQKISH